MISSNPYHPLQPTAGITHTWMGESWMVDGEVLVTMVAMISSDSPSRQGARTELLVSGIGFRVVAAYRTSFWKNFEPPVSFTSRSYSREGRPRKCRRRPDTGQARPGLARTWALSGPLRAFLLFTFWLREFPVKIRCLPIFLGFFRKVGILHKNKTPGQFC